jgi:Ca-activated chloride channel homolog
MCPSGETPLGIHIQALADRLGDGDEERPNRITVISDGVSNNGTDPIQVAKSIHEKYPHLQVDIIDVSGNPGLRNIASITGGAYYHTDDPDELLKALYVSAGVCGSYSPPNPPADKPGCGSSGNWWK